MPEKLYPDSEDAGFGMDQLHPQGLVEGLRVMEVDHGIGSSSKWRHTSWDSFQGALKPSPVLVEGMHSGSTEGGEKPGLQGASSP